MNTQETKSYDKIKVSKKDNIVTLEGEIPIEAIEFHKNEALQELKKDFKFPGFRPGNVPDHIFREHISEEGLFKDSADTALKDAYPLMLDEYKIKAFTYPRVEIKKMQLNTPLEFKIMVGVIPECKLPHNYRKLAKEVPKESFEVTDDDIAKIIKEIETARSTETDSFILTDETVKMVGKFETMEEFKKQLRSHLEEEKREHAKMKRREEIAKILLEKTICDFPKFWEEDEKLTIEKELEDHAASHAISKEKVLEGYKKTEEEFISEELAYRAKNEKIKIILEKIAETEKIIPSEEEIEREAMNLRAYYKEIDYTKLKKVSETALIRRKALELLESEE